MRFLITFIFSALIIGTGVFFFEKGKEKSFVKEEGITLRTEKVSFTIDTDGDGLKDWEEELWKTDINNPDTDMDGSTDTEEIREGRDPNKPGPDDLLNKEVLVNKVNSEIEADLTETDKLGRELFAEYTGEKGSGAIPSVENYTNILYKSLQKNAEKEPSKVYSYEDLKIVVTQNSAILSKFGNEVGKVLLYTPEKSVPHELDLYEQASKTKKSSAFDGYSEIIELYTKTRDDLLEIQVPSGAKDDFLLMINSYTAIIDSLPEISFLLSDPVRSVVGFRIYVDAIEGVTKAKQNLSLYFKENKITFTQKEDGSLFYRSI